MYREVSLHCQTCLAQTICGKAYSTSFNENYIGHYIYFSHGIFLGACNLGCDQANLHTSCGRLLNCDRLEVHIVSIYILFFVIPLTTELVTHALILRQIRKLDARRKKSTMKAYKTVMLTVGVYYLCTVPLSITLAARAAFIDIPIFIEYAANEALLFNSAVNFWIYLTTLPRFQEHFKTITPKCVTFSCMVHPQ